MLPFLNLTSFEFIATDKPQGAGNLVPEAPGTLRGVFAHILQSAARPEALQPAPAGELLPVPGNPLPAALSGDTPALATNLGLPADVELPVDEIDVSHLVFGRVPGDTAGKAAQGPISASLTDTGLPPETALPATVHVPPQPGVVDTLELDVPVVRVDPAVDGDSGAPQTLPATPLPIADDREGLLEHRERALEWTAPASRPAAVPAEPLPAAPEVVRPTASDIAVVPRATRDDHARVPRERLPLADALTTSRESAAPQSVRDYAPQAIRDDGTVPARPLQPAASQLGAVAHDVAPEPGQRVHTEFAAAMPRVANNTPPLPQPLPATQTLDVPVQQSGWDSALAERVTLMARGRVQTAELRLTPAELGPLRIQLEIDDGVANVSFQSQHPLTRDALEQAMPRLRELLAENGLSLGEADVRDDSGQQASRESQADARAAATHGSGDSDGDEPATLVTRRAADGLVDTFA